nr:RNA-directed DNA polymerase, eukaryota, reverse transcriptase zinc-binding domain protein [Tanacetum cinerariifolium]
MRFINVFNEDRLVNNLCTVWIGRYKLQVNLARFQRTPVSEVKNLVKDEGGKKGSSNHINKKVNEDKYVKISTSSGNSFVQAVKGNNLYGGGETELFPAAVLDDECLVTKDLSKSLLGRVKEFACIANLKVALFNEVLGLGSRVLNKHPWISSRREELHGWRLRGFRLSCGRIIHLRELRIGGVLLDIDDQEETCYHSKHESDDEYQEDDTSKNGGSNDHDSSSGRGESEMEEVLETLFQDDRLVKNDMKEGDNISVGSLKYPLGFTPHESSDVDCMHVKGDRNVNVEEVRVNLVGVVNDGSSGNRFNTNSKEDSVESVVSGHFKKSMISRTGALFWDFLQWEISKWTGDVVIMGDFNEVRYKLDRFGSVFNAHCASLFNSFIRTSGLVEVNLDGSSFTWCHKSATKMSKLDRFLVFESFLYTCPNINVITLERYMSDHRPILLRESHVDYGPTPFWFFHYWLEMEGSCKVVEDRWKESPCDSSNAMRNLLGKLKHLKKVIRVWNKTNTINVNNIKAQHKITLEAVDSCIDKGNGTEEDIKRRVEILNKIPDIDKLKSLEMAQKAKVKWAVEGDENSSFFHGVLNKKTSATLQMRLPKCITLDQKQDMECEVTNDEIKKAVWDCGTDKASGPDSFTFGFYRRFWYLIDNDVYDAVRYFFIYSKRDKVNRVAMKLGCLVLKAPFLYLGSMVGGAMSKANAWSEVVDRVKNRLSKWKMKTLSIGGRLTLLKSVLGSMPIFHMSMFKVSSGVLSPLESLRSRFFNGHDTNSRKASWVKWKTVLASKERGGLDVSSLYALNRGLLFKWIWRRAGKRPCWLNIIHEVKALLNMGIDLKKYMRIKLGDGENTAF